MRTAEFYDKLAARLRSPEELGQSIRIDPEGHRVSAIREMLRERGVYVTISAQQWDRPFVTLRVIDLVNPRVPAVDSRAPVVLSEEEANALFAEYGIRPEEG